MNLACDEATEATEATEAHAWIQAGDGQRPEIPADFSNPVIATIDGAQPGKIEFLDESRVSGGSAIGMIAIGPEGAQALALLDAEGASPLEVFLALAPADAAPPPMLVDDHAALAVAGEASIEPRALVSLRAETFYNYMCSTPPDEPSGFNTFWSGWSSGYGTTNQSTFVSAVTDLNVQTLPRTKRALAACVDTYGGATMTIQKRDSGGTTWSTVYHQGSVCHRCGVAYRSSTPTDASQYREVIWANQPEDFFVAASWGN